MRPASQRFFIHSCIYIRILIISYLATFLGTNSLSVLMCRKAVNQSITIRSIQPALSYEVLLTKNVSANLQNKTKSNRGFQQNRTEPAIFFKTETEPKFKNTFRKSLLICFSVVTPLPVWLLITPMNILNWSCVGALGLYSSCYQLIVSFGCLNFVQFFAFISCNLKGNCKCLKTCTCLVVDGGLM